MKPIVETAHLMGRKVLAHAHGNRGIKAALQSGVDSIEHGSYLDQDNIDFMKEKGVYLVPTLSAGELLRRAAEIPGYFPPAIAEKARRVAPMIKESLIKAYQNNLKIAFGTDAGVSPHGDNAKEFQYLVDSGVDPLDAIFMATRNAADLLGKSDEIGSVQVGRYADLVAVKGNPLEDVTLLQNIAFVMKDGKIYKQC